MWGLLVTIGGAIAIGAVSLISGLATVLIYIGVALFAALALEPAIVWAESRRVRRPVAVLGVALTLLVVVSGVIALVVPVIQSQLALLIESLPGLVDELLTQQWVMDTLSRVGSGDLDSTIRDALAFATNPDSLIALGGGLWAVGKGVAEGVTAVVVVCILTIYFTSTLPGLKRVVYAVVPRSKRAGFVELTEEMSAGVGRYVAGQVGLAGLNAIFVFLLLTFGGGPAPALLAFVAFVGALIPVVGTVASFAVVTISTLIITPVFGIVVGILLLVYAQVEAYLLTPRVMARAVAIPGSLVIIAALGGAALGGVLGALVAVPISAAGVIFYNRVVVPTQNRR